MAQLLSVRSPPTPIVLVILALALFSGLFNAQPAKASATGRTASATGRNRPRPPRRFLSYQELMQLGPSSLRGRHANGPGVGTDERGRVNATLAAIASTLAPQKNNAARRDTPSVDRFPLSLIDQIASLVLVDHNSAATVAKTLNLHQNTIRACLKKSQLSHETRQSDRTDQSTLLTAIREDIGNARQTAKRGKPWPDQIKQKVVNFALDYGLAATAASVAFGGLIPVATIKVWLQHANEPSPRASPKQ